MRFLLPALLVAVASLPAAALAQAAPADNTPQQTCPCSDYRFTPLTEKATAVQKYWEARQAWNLAAGVGSTMTLLALLAHDPNTVAAAKQAYDDAFQKMLTTRERAQSLGGLTVKQGEDVEHDVVTITLVKGVDYRLTPP